MTYKYYYIIISSILIILTGCKDSNEIKLESIIDEFEYLKNNNLIEEKKLQNLKAQFENISHTTTEKVQVSALYYLSKIATMENKLDEAYHFINQAYEINHADSIYKQLYQLKEKLNPVIDTAISELPKNDLDLINIFEIGRTEIKDLYKNKNYLGAISQTHVLINMMKSLTEEIKIKVELAQLYQDLAIFYSQQNQITEAKKFIEQAIILNATPENLEIQQLINKK
tara:strand:- start:285 stop:965 length:681 start_codon:yes stop_codon:yes gene_type:complete